jgi:hypothetical protein
LFRNARTLPINLAWRLRVEGRAAVDAALGVAPGMRANHLARRRLPDGVEIAPIRLMDRQGIENLRANHMIGQKRILGLPQEAASACCRK